MRGDPPFVANRCHSREPRRIFVISGRDVPPPVPLFEVIRAAAIGMRASGPITMKGA
jgi:hypothetical protein